MPIYEVNLTKEKTYWWDEEKYGNVTFVAESDEAVRQFVATIVQRMNRTYWRMREQRNVYIESICRLEERGSELESIEIPIWNCMSPLKGFRQIRIALETFYPKKDKRRSLSIMHMFENWRPIPCRT